MTDTKQPASDAQLAAASTAPKSKGRKLRTPFRRRRGDAVQENKALAKIQTKSFFIIYYLFKKEFSTIEIHSFIFLHAKL